MSKQEVKKPMTLVSPSLLMVGTEFSAKNALLTIGTLQVMAKMWTIKGGFKTLEEYTCGTDFPRVLHAGYSGTFESESIYASGDILGALGFPGTRDQVITVVSVDNDTSGGSKTLTFHMKVKEFQRVGPANADGVIKCKLTGTLIDLPTGL